MILLIHEGVKAKEYKKSSALLDSNLKDNDKFQIMLVLIKDGLKVNPKKY